MSGLIDLQLSGVITFLILQAVVIGAWVVTTQGVKIGRLERQRGSAPTPMNELRKIRILFAEFHEDHVALNDHLAEALAEVESTTADLDSRIRTLSRRLDHLHEDVTGKLDRDATDAAQLRALQKLVQSLPETLAEQLERNDNRHRRPSRGRQPRRPGDGHDDEPLSFPQPA